ncbi:hypothetical protein FH972_020981 [Carpinus fangiana]|uniref:F-box domain-containing protein n=1 Tax=Carpinus fangiana TaxID=176857 RepID=A0A5N6KNM5_9ROSI|nr:hypothetical protein FH972_020981 [Carpinus fangiana]
MASCRPFLGSLHSELLDLILAYLPQNDLLSVALSSRHLHQHAQAPIYRNTFILTIPALERLCKTFLRRPGLARFCRTARIVVNEAQLYASSDEANEEKDTIRRSPEGRLTLILGCLDRIQSLHLTVRTWNDTPDFSTFITNPLNSNKFLGCFEHLRDVHFKLERLDDQCGGFTPDVRDPLLFLTLPALQRLSMNLATTVADIQLPLPSASPAELRMLKLSRGSCITLPALRSILARTPKLESFEYHFTCNFEVMQPETKCFYSSVLASSLEPTAQTLRHLHISCQFLEFTGSHMLWNDDWGYRGQLTSLKEFSRLQSLTIPLVVLLGWKPSESLPVNEKLPPGLVNLTIRTDGSHWDDFTWASSDAEHYISGYLKDGCSKNLSILELYASAARGHIWTPELVGTLQAIRPDMVIKATGHLYGNEQE